MFTLRQAALYLGYSTSGLRKLVAKRRIKFTQPGKWGGIKFRQEWLDEFVEENSTDPNETETKRKKKRLATEVVSTGKTYKQHGLGG